MALDGRRVVVELRAGADGELGRYTLKRWKVGSLGPDGTPDEIVLLPDNHDYQSIRLRPSDGEIRVVAELLEALS